MNNIYVDELPKSRNGCKFQVFIAHHKNGWEHKERYCSIMKNNYDCICSKENCPLKPLIDRLAEERKKVVQEIREKALLKQMNIDNDYDYEVGASNDWVICIEDLDTILDQIERSE